MAGDWIKMRGNLWDDPRLARLCDATDQPEAMIVGALYWLWATADQHTEDGIMPGLTLRAIDRKTGVPGFGQAMCDIGWLADHPEGVRIINFEEHNGASAKKRCQTAKRVANFKAANAQETQEEDSGNAQSVSTALPREEKRREEVNTPPNPRKRGKSAKPTEVPCPYESIVGTYHAALPTLPAVRLMPEARQRVMRKVWGWVLSSSRPDGTRRATNADEALQWFRDYFERASLNDFLMGRTPRTGEHVGWQCDLDFLLSDKGMKLVIEKTQEAA